MTGVPFVDAEELRRVLPMEAAVDALEAAFGSVPLPDAPLRAHMETRDGTLLSMPAAGQQGAGVKLVTITPANPGRGLPLIHGVYALFAPGSQAPEAVLDGAALTALRTGAVSGLATRYLAPPDARRLVVFGAGTQARSHVAAMRAVRPIEHVTVVSRTRERAQALVAELRATGLEAEAGEPSAVSSADVVCTCTTSTTPVLDGTQVRDGAHLNAIGAYTPRMRELDDVVVMRAALAVETREAAMAEAGDLLIPMREGRLPADARLYELAEVVTGTRVRTSERDVTVFKSVGVAFEDLVVARAAVDRLAR